MTVSDIYMALWIINHFSAQRTLVTGGHKIFIVTDFFL